MRLLSFITVFCVFCNVDAWVTPSNYPLKVSKTGRSFVTVKNDPFFWQADTAWVLFHRLNISEAELYLEDRAAKGFNMILVVALNQFG